MEIDEEKFRQIFREYGPATVGRICKNIEVVQKGFDKQSEVYKTLELIKNLHRETIYENLRDIELTVRYASKGLKYQKHNIFKNPQSPTG